MLNLWYNARLALCLDSVSNVKALQHYCENFADGSFAALEINLKA